MAIFLRPLDCLTLRLEGREDVVGVVLDNIVVDGVSFGPTLWTRLDIDIWPTRSKQYFIITRKQPHLREATITKMITACAKAPDAD